MKFEEALLGFEKRLRELNRSQATLKTYLRPIRYFTDWLILKGIEHPGQITPERLKEYQKDFDERSKEKEYSPETRQHYLRGIKRFLEHLEKTHQLLINPSESLLIPRLVKHRIVKEILTEEEITRMIEGWDRSILGLRNRAIMELMYSTGVRLSELVGLDMEDIDIEGGFIRIQGGKGAKDRIQPLGRKATHPLRDYLKNARQELIQEKDESALFISSHHRRISHCRINQIVREMAQRLALAKPVSAHTFRRTFATHLLRNNAHPYYVKELLGHSDLGSLERYLKIAGKDLKKEHTRTHPREKKRSKVQKIKKL
ncbi:MAG: tyrosine-type recombinase/integrase [Chlamydiae bacterium]|nr:tyrosine-type recombinase/integrase [Chlamydiota bacterium]